MPFKLLHLMTKYKLHAVVAQENMLRYSKVGGLQGYEYIPKYVSHEARQLLMIKMCGTMPKWENESRNRQQCNLRENASIFHRFS